MDKSLQKTYSNTVDILAFVKYVLKRWYLVMLAVIAGAVATIPIILLTVRPEYTCEAKYYLASADETVSYGSLQAISYIMDDYLAMIKSSTVVKRAVERNHLDLNEGEVLKMISVSNPDDTHLVVVKVKSWDEQQVKEVSDALSFQILNYIPTSMKGTSVTIFEEPKTSMNNVSEEKLRIMIISVILCFMIMVMLLLMKFLTRPVAEDYEEIADEFGSTLVYLLPKRSRKLLTWSDRRIEKVQNRLETVIEEIIFNLSFDMGQDQHQSIMIMVTSPAYGAGASFLAKRLYKKLQKEQVKAVLVDDDLKKERSKEIDTSKDGISLFSLEYNESLQETINQLKDSYRFIIVDASPVLETPKSLILAKYSDKNIMVVKYGKTSMYDLRKSVKRFEEKEFTVHSIVLNQYSSGKEE